MDRVLPATPERFATATATATATKTVTATVAAEGRLSGVAIDPSFAALPLEAVRSSALERAIGLGCSHGEIRVERIRSQVVVLRDGRVETTVDDTEIGMGLRVVRDGSVGFAATVELHPDAAVELAERATAMAAATAPALAVPVELAAEPGYGEVVWTSAYEIDPTLVPVAEKVAALEDWSRRLLGHGAVDHATAYLLAVVEDKHFADLTGRVTTQRRVRIHPVVEVFAVDGASGGFESMRSLAPPAGRGWEYVTGSTWDWDAEIDRLGDLLAEKLAARRSTPAPTTWSSIRAISGSPSTSRSGTPPNSTGPWDTRRPTPAPPSPPSTSWGAFATARA